jgi:ribulose kinase
MSDHDPIGIDFGPLSGRGVVVQVCDGAEIADAEHAYASGVILHRLRRIRNKARGNA